MKFKKKIDSTKSEGNVWEIEEAEDCTSNEGYVRALEDAEEMDLSDVKPSEKRKRKEEADSSFRVVKSKRHKRDVKPPTAEEMIRLRETENLFQSNLFRLQIEEMINELKPRKTDKNAIKHWIQNFKQFLSELNESEVVILDDHKNVFNDVRHPLPKKKWEINNPIKVFRPLDVKLMGSYANGTVLGPSFILELALIIPMKYFQKEDYLNQRFHYKRAFFLSKIAAGIKQSALVSPKFEMKFWLKYGDPLKPFLLFRPEGRMTQFVQIALNIIPEISSLKMNRFLPEKNNVRPEWCGIERKSGTLPPTPHYNMTILEDIVAQQNENLKLETFEDKQNLKDAVVLLCVWLKQRKLLEGFGGFNEHILTMFMVYLAKKQKINNHMSSYQISRNVWLAIAQTDWSKEGLSLCFESPPCSVEIFHKYFEIVFVDCSGYHNLCFRLNKTTYFRVKEEADRAIKLLNDPDVNSFQSLFMANMPFLQQYDHFICFTDPAIIETVTYKNSSQEKRIDHSDHSLPIFIKLVVDLLVEGLGNRLSYLGVEPIALPQWNIAEEGPGTLLSDVLTFGLKLNPETALSIIEKGPEANNNQAARFREFWGEKCELRRFRDGTVCESVCWIKGEASLNDRRLIVNKIIKYLLEQKLEITSQNYNYVADQLHHLVINKLYPQISNEEASQAVHKAFENISQLLRDMNELPLNIVSVRCISPVYRFTEVFPPQPSSHYVYKKICNYSQRGVLFKEKEEINASPFYVEPIDLVLQMTLSQKWPNDLKAGKRLIAAFNIVIASILKKKHGLSCQITTDYVTVQKEGYIFRLHLGYSKEVTLLKQQINALGVMYYRNTPESTVIEKKFINLPKVTGALYGLSQSYSAYGCASCLAKRWINSHLFNEFHFPSMVIELLMARLFISPEPYSVTLQPLTAFLRFLSYMATTNWHIEPVLINFNKLLTKEQIADIEKSFQTNRSTLPPLVIYTPYDMVGSLWTKDAPSLPTLIRVAKLAAASLKMLDVYLVASPIQKNLLKVFEPPLSSYDAVITFKKNMLPRRLQCISFNKKIATPNLNDIQLPIAGFDPASLYVEELKNKYKEYAQFYHNTYGGGVVGVIFKPNFLKAVDFKTSHVGPRKPKISEGKVSLIASKEMLINGFYILGAGLVENIVLK